MSASVDHRSEAEVALAHAQRNPIMSAEQWFLSAQIHALLALDDATRSDRKRVAGTV